MSSTARKTTARVRAIARRLGHVAHLYQCAKCQAWTESPVCMVCPPA